MCVKKSKDKYSTTGEIHRRAYEIYIFLPTTKPVFTTEKCGLLSSFFKVSKVQFLITCINFFDV